ncbi:MAG: NfeD family protein [Sulfurospirillaceae bacterium]|nr:NfeD family protein [Sulfurospirillaceae bacterium]MDD3462970.1 NfeD family protein [Sulfurospirillaceae bacterium]
MVESIVPVLSPLMLFGLGILLVAIEVLAVSFFVIWFALSAFVVGGISAFYQFSDGLHQLALISFLGLVLLVLFYKKTKQYFSKSQRDIKDDFLNTQGEGTISNGQLSYKGTFWKYSSSDTLQDGDIVKVLKIDSNIAVVEKLK